MRWPTRILLAVFAVVTGGIFGIAGTIAHAFRWGVLPVGLILALLGCAALLIGLRLLIESRWITWIAGLALLAAVLLFSGTGPGGSVVVPQAAEGEFPIGVVWTYAATGVVLLIGAWPDVSRFRTLTPVSQSGAEDESPETRRIDA